MTPQRIIGLVMLVLGLVLLIVGLNASDSFADELSEAFTGRWTDETSWYVYGGLALGLVGGLILAFGGGGRHRLT